MPPRKLTHWGSYYCLQKKTIRRQEKLQETFAARQKKLAEGRDKADIIAPVPSLPFESMVVAGLGAQEGTENRQLIEKARISYGYLHANSRTGIPICANYAVIDMLQSHKIPH